MVWTLGMIRKRAAINFSLSYVSCCCARLGGHQSVLHMASFLCDLSGHSIFSDVTRLVLLKRTRHSYRRHCYRVTDRRVLLSMLSQDRATGLERVGWFRNK